MVSHRNKKADVMTVVYDSQIRCGVAYLRSNWFLSLHHSWFLGLMIPMHRFVRKYRVCIFISVQWEHVARDSRPKGLGFGVHV